MSTIRVLEWETSYATYRICDARTPTDAELAKYAEWYRSQCLFGGGNEIVLKHFSWRDLTAVLGERKSTHSFPGCNNNVWILSPADESAILEIERSREQAKASASSAKDAAEQSRKADLTALAANTGKPQILNHWMDECDGTAHDCSFDSVALMVRADGSTYTTRTHCH